MLTTGSRIGNWCLVICLFSVVSHVELVHLSPGASSFVPRFRGGGHYVGRNWCTKGGWEGGKYIRGCCGREN